MSGNDDVRHSGFRGPTDPGLPTPAQIPQPMPQTQSPDPVDVKYLAKVLSNSTGIDPQSGGVYVLYTDDVDSLTPTLQLLSDMFPQALFLACLHHIELGEILTHTQIAKGTDTSYFHVRSVSTEQEARRRMLEDIRKTIDRYHRWPTTNTL